MNKILSVILCASLFSALSAMEDSNYEFRLASEHDVEGLVSLMNNEACEEHGLVTPPKGFREAYFSAAIKNNELFVIAQGAKEDTKEVIVGYKKLSFLDDDCKREKILKEEIRCLGSESVYSGIITLANNKELQFKESKQEPVSEKTTYIYTGADFTSKKHRGKGLNSRLMKVALRYNKSGIVDDIHKKGNNGLAVVYGITEENGAFNLGGNNDRTCPIVKDFIPFAQEVELDLGCKESDVRSKNVVVSHERYRAFKPSFAQNSDTFEPLPDNFSVEGNGVRLLYPFKHKGNK